jgi:flagellin-like protein
MKKDSGFKGISPLVAVIMLIAFTMVVAGILASWASQFAMTQRQQIQTCSEAFIFLQNGVYSSTDQTLTLNVWNSGQVNLTGINVIITHTNESYSSYMNNITIGAGMIKAITVESISTDIKQVVVRSEECRGAQDLLLKYNIKGL